MRSGLQGRRLLGSEMAVTLLLCFFWVHWPDDGPRTVKDFLDRMRSAVYAGLLAYHAEWVQNSGIGERSAVCRKLRLLLELLRTLVETGHVDVSSFAGTELMVRRGFPIELAAEQNPWSPDFDSLDALLDTVSSALRDGAEVRLVGFGTFSRLYRPAGLARNPRTGEAVRRPAMHTARFRAGDGLKRSLN